MPDEVTKHTHKPPGGYVPDQATAISIAIAVWKPIYGEKEIDGQRPFHAVLNNGVWTVTGTLPEEMVGGVALAEIAKDNGKIIRVSHGK